LRAAAKKTVSQTDYQAEFEALNKKYNIIVDNNKIAIRKLTTVDNFLDDQWHKIDNKELSKVVTELREAINLLNTS
jgi:hypothetical protein